MVGSPSVWKPIAKGVREVGGGGKMSRRSTGVIVALVAKHRSVIEAIANLTTWARVTKGVSMLPRIIGTVAMVIVMTTTSTIATTPSIATI